MKNRERQIRPLNTPTKIIRGRCESLKRAMPKVPERVIILYQRELGREIADVYGGTPIEGISGKLHLISYARQQVVLVTDIGIGAPSAAIALEEIIATGGKKIITIGTAGSLDERLKPGDLLLVKDAISEEGTSGHYPASKKRPQSSPKLMKKIKKLFYERREDFAVGTCCSTDAPYRETNVKVLDWKLQGAVCVEMEAAAVYNIASYHNIDALSVVVISDRVYPLHEGVRYKPLIARGRLESVVRKIIENSTEW